MRTIDHRPPVAVVGEAAVGCYFGAMLARFGVRVTLVGLLDGLRVRERIPAAAPASIAACVHDGGVALLREDGQHRIWRGLSHSRQ